MRKGRQYGLNEGYQRGHEAGYRLGLQTNQLQKIPVLSPTPFPVSLVYVTAGIGDPYPALDQAIIQSLSAYVAKLSVASPGDDVLRIAQEAGAQAVLALNAVTFPEDQVSRLRAHGIKTAVWFTDDPYYTDWTVSIAPRYDYIFTLEENCVSFYQGLGCKHVYHLPFAANEAIFAPKQVPVDYHSDICFIGTAFWNRVHLIDAMAPMLQNYRVVIIGWWWDRLKNYQLLKNNIKLGDWLSAEETANYYNGARIVINHHRAHDDATINANGYGLEAHSVNPRTFEISSCGTLQLASNRKGLGSSYVPNEEIAIYDNEHDLMNKIRFYLANEPERRRVATAGLLRSRRDHTYHHRIDLLLRLLFA